MSSYQFSDVDRAIVDMLKVDGRASNQKIADELGISTSMVTSRIKKMEAEKAMRVIAVSDFNTLKYNVLLPIGIDVKGRQANAVAQELADLDEVASVQLVSGKHDIEILVALQSLDNMSEFLLSKLSKIEGVRSLDSAIAVDIIKYNFDVAPI